MSKLMSVDDWSPQYMMKSLENLMPVASVVGPCSGQPAPPSSQLPAFLILRTFVKASWVAAFFMSTLIPQIAWRLGGTLKYAGGVIHMTRADPSGFSRQEGEVSLPLSPFYIKEKKAQWPQAVPQVCGQAWIWFLVSPLVCVLASPSQLTDNRVFLYTRARFLSHLPLDFSANKDSCQ